MVLRTILLKPMKKNLLIYAKSLKTSIQLKSLADNNTHKCMIKINEEILTASVTTQLLPLNNATCSITAVFSVRPSTSPYSPAQWWPTKHNRKLTVRFYSI